MRILYAVHHPLDPKLGGAPSASIEIARAIERLGHTVSFYGYDQAYGPGRSVSAWNQLAFPWQLARFLARNRRRFDILDVTTGDGYLWSALSRVSADNRPRMITRSNGLEHLASRALLARAPATGETVSWRYRLYHGGPRLWEVEQSFRLADGAVVLNEDERRFAVDQLGAKPDATWVIPHGLNDYLRNVDVPTARRLRSPRIAKLCFIGNWGPHKNKSDVVATAEVLSQRGRDVSVLVAGANQPEATVLAEFSPAMRDHVRVVPRYERRDLSRLLAGTDFLIFPSFFEGFSLAIVEAMACGVVPIASSVGAAPDIIEDGTNGVLVPVSQPFRIADAVERLLDNPTRLKTMRMAAHATANKYSWASTAEQTLGLYQAVRGA